MKSLILDRYAHLPLSKRFLWGSLTLLGWAWWVSLWLPLLRPSHEVAYNAEHAGPPRSSFAELFVTLRSHISLVGSGLGLFLVWSFLKWCGERRHRPVPPCVVSSQQLARSIRLSEEMLNTWQRTQRMVVQHDEESGWIHSVSAQEECRDSPESHRR